MTYSTLMVHLELEHSNDARLQIAGDLAEQFDAKLIGIAAADPQPAYYAGGALRKVLSSASAPKSKSEWSKLKHAFVPRCSIALATSNGAPQWLGLRTMCPSKHVRRILSSRASIGTDYFSIPSGASILAIW